MEKDLCSLDRDRIAELTRLLSEQREKTHAMAKLGGKLTFKWRVADG